MNAPDSNLPGRPRSSPALPQVQRIPLRLPESKDCLIEFLVSDLRDGIGRAENALPLLDSAQERVQAGIVLAAIGEATAKSARFFEFDLMLALGKTLARLGDQSGRLPDTDLTQATPRIAAILELLKEQADGLAWGTIIRRPVGGLCDAVRVFLETGTLPAERMLKPGASAMDALMTDGVVIRDGDAAPAPLPVFPVDDEIEVPGAKPGVGVPAGAPSIAAPVVNPAPVAPIFSAPPVAPVQQIPVAPLPVMQAPVEPSVPAPVVEEAPITPVSTPAIEEPAQRPAPSVRPRLVLTRDADDDMLPPRASDPFSDLFKEYVPVAPDRLDHLLGLVSDLVMQKNRLVALGSHLPRDGEDPARFHEFLSRVTTSISRVAADLRASVGESRKIPMARLCAQLATVVEESGAATGKPVKFSSEGSETEADCGLLDRLNGPLSALVRAMIDLGIEPARERADARKPACGSIKVRASLASNSLLVSVEDDGRGLSRRRISKKAVRLGILSDAEADRLSDKNIFALLFSPEFAVKADPRDPDMGPLHTLRETINGLGGTVEITGFETRGTTISIVVPLHAVTMPALLVEIGGQTFALPASGVREVFRSDPPPPPATKGIKPGPFTQTLQREDGEIRILDGCDVFSLPSPEGQLPPSTVVVLAQGGKRIGLRVARAMGTCDIVVRPLDPMAVNFARGPVCGATIRDDGSIALVIDAPRAVRLAEDRARAIDRTPPRFGTAA